MKIKISHKMVSSLSLLLHLSVLLIILTPNFEAAETYQQETNHSKSIFSLNSFLEAIESEDMERVKQFIEAGIDINGVVSKNGVKITPLVWAIHTRKIKVARFLIEKGSDINIITDAGTPLMQAAMKGNTEIAKLLIEKGADVNMHDELGFTALMYATEKDSFEVAKLLIKEGANVNAKNILGVTSLMYAAGKGNIELVKLLIDNGADINVRDKARNFTALDWASEKRNIEVAELLKEFGAIK